jgi:hypothetical protein
VIAENKLRAEVRLRVCEVGTLLSQKGAGATSQRATRIMRHGSQQILTRGLPRIAVFRRSPGTAALPKFSRDPCFTGTGQELRNVVGAITGYSMTGLGRQRRPSRLA